MSGKNTFSRQERLLSEQDFKKVFAKPKKVNSNIFTLLCRENQLGYPRIGSLIARKKVKSAVERNKLKRGIKESFRLRKQLLENCDYVFIKNKGKETAKFNLHTELDFLWKNFQNQSE